MIKGLTYVILPAQDLPATRRFFVEKLGVGTEDDQGDVFSQIATHEGSGWGILPAGNTVEGQIELYLQVDDLDAAYRTWKERGVEMATEPHDEPFGRTFAFLTPDRRTLHAYVPA